METTEELVAFLQQTTVDGYRGRLQARGEARALIRHEGALPPDSPEFSADMDSDLAEYAFSLLRAALALREQGGDENIWRNGLVRSGNAFEALVQNGDATIPSRGFHRILGAAAYHLANYSALAFSLVSQGYGNQNYSPAEEVIALLITRDLENLRGKTKAWLLDPDHSDSAISATVAQAERDIDDVVNIISTTTVFRALAFFEFALQTGEAELMQRSIVLLERATNLAYKGGAVSLWWIFRVTKNLLEDLWGNCLHQVLPRNGPSGSLDYVTLRRLFIGELYTRGTAEIELWPSQVQAARRAADVTDDLVVALPTSAGKTRIAEVCALMALSCGKRVLILTPLRALSAQTERTFRRTFTPLGFSVSSLYGASGMAGNDADALRQRHIVISTPEKLDFALRSDPTIIDDVGLIILDEGHMIGPSEREIRYENLVQRLLHRQDQQERRIVCLSAILPEGDNLDDLTGWIRSDTQGGPVQANWRPTRQRFGTLSWLGNSARLSFDLEPDGPFIRHFVPEAPPIAPRRTPFPRDNKELTLAAAWKFSEQGKRTLVFCTQRDHVEGFAETAIDLHRRGFLPTLLDDAQTIERALSVGREWLGANHPALRCLEIGLAIHHARLPAPFLRELEALLGSGVLRVTVASPTLAQGLNLNAAVLLVPTLYRAGTPIKGEEFANVAGRAGRAYVDMEGLVVHVMYEPHTWRFQAWRQLVSSARARSLSSGIILVVDEVIRRLASTGVFQRADAMEYLSNSQEAWFPEGTEEDEDSIESLVERLDATVLGLIEALDSDSADLPRLLDEALTGSLWSRQIARLAAERKQQQMWILVARAQLIWNKSTAPQRFGQFAMGVGLESGLAIDAMSDHLMNLVSIADTSAVEGNVDGLVDSLVGIGRHLLTVRPFKPDEELPANWPDLLRMWVRGDGVEAIGIENMRMVDDAFVYRLVWAIESLRMLRRVRGQDAEGIEGAAAACLEAGLPAYAAAMLVRAGLSSRVAAFAVVSELQPAILTRRDLIAWLQSDLVVRRSEDRNWPTPETGEIWRSFRDQTLTDVVGKWSVQEWRMDLEAGSVDGSPYPNRIDVDSATGRVAIASPDYQPLVSIAHTLEQSPPGIWQATYSDDLTEARITRIGRGEARWLAP